MGPQSITVGFTNPILHITSPPNLGFGAWFWWRNGWFSTRTSRTRTRTREKTGGGPMNLLCFLLVALRGLAPEVEPLTIHPMPSHPHPPCLGPNPTPEPGCGCAPVGAPCWWNNRPTNRKRKAVTWVAHLEDGNGSHWLGIRGFQNTHGVIVGTSPKTSRGNLNPLPNWANFMAEINGGYLLTTYDTWESILLKDLRKNHRSWPWCVLKSQKFRDREKNSPVEGNGWYK